MAHTHKRSVLRSVLLVLAASAVAIDAPSAFQCGSCNQGSAFRSTSVRLDFSGVSFEVETWRAAAQEWTDLYAAAGTPTINVALGSGDWKIVLVEPSQMPGAWGDAHTPSKNLYIRSDALTKGAGFVKWLFSHEIGHTLGLTTTDCSINDSVMAERQPDPTQPGGVAGTTSLGCAIDRYIRQNYEPEPTDYCSSGGCTPGYAPMGSTGCSEGSQDECGCCLTYSPIVLDLAADGVRFSGTQDGVMFTINDAGRRFRIGWPLAADDVWLWLDRNGNGNVDSGAELFGNATRLSNGRPATNGFVALAELDGNRDGLIDATDAAFNSLQVWSDANRDGISQPGETSGLATTSVRAIELSYRESRHTDRFGNVFRYRSVLHLAGANGRTWAWDVYPVVDTAAPGTSPQTCAKPVALR